MTDRRFEQVRAKTKLRITWFSTRFDWFVTRMQLSGREKKKSSGLTVFLPVFLLIVPITRDHVQS